MSAVQSIEYLLRSKPMRHFLAFIITFLFISSASQAAILSVGDGLRILAIDGQVITEKNTLPVEIEKGKRQLVIRYNTSLKENNSVFSNSYRNSNNKREIVSSSPYIFFVNINQDTQISVQKFSSAFQAKSAIQRGLVFIIENEQEQKQKQKLIDNADKLKGNGVNPFSPVNLKPLIDSYNQAHDIHYQ